MKSPIVLLAHLLTDVKRWQSCVRGLDRDLITIKNRFEHEGFSFLSVALSTMCDALDFGLAHGRFTCPSSFSKMKNSALPKLFSGLLCEVFDSASGDLRDDASIQAVKSLREICRLFKKTQLTSKRSKLLHDEAVRSFRDTDKQLRGLQFDPRYAYIVSQVSKVVLNDLEKRSLEHFLPYRHGPGAVREGVHGNSKWKWLFNHLQDDAVNFIPTGFGDFLYSSNKEAALTPVGLGMPVGGCAKLISVPKTAVAVRTITVEPIVNQFVQQAMNTILRDSIAHCSILKQCLALTDQSKNQSLALAGSITGNWTTVDLSSASDLMSTKLVKLVFQNHPLFLERILSCRSSVVSTDLGDLHLEKYAGMGNATTFPVQSVVFAILCICSQIDHDGVSPSYWNIKRAAENTQVFGDDIIIKTAYYHTMNRWISSFGLRVNEKKTFSTGNFRESCGCDAFRGVDVTPTYVRTDPSSTSLTASSLASLIATSNLFWIRGLHSASTVLRYHVEDFLRKRLPLVNKDSGLLGWNDRYGSSEATSWSSEHHTLEISSLAIVPKKRKDSISGYPALLKFFMTSLIERSSDHLEKSVVRYNSRTVTRRVPAHAG